MALPDKTRVLSMEFGYAGSPAVMVPAKDSITTLGLSYGYKGSPFVAAEGEGAPPTPPDEIYIMMVIT